MVLQQIINDENSEVGVEIENIIILTKCSLKCFLFKCPQGKCLSAPENGEWEVV